MMSLAEEQQLLDVAAFDPEYRQAFQAWLKTDALANPDAPPGPAYMPGYVNLSMAEASRRNREAQQALEEGTAARGRAEAYVKITVVLATVLFLIALSQRFRAEGVRIAVLVVAGSMIAYALIMCLRLPRL